MKQLFLAGCIVTRLDSQKITFPCHAMYYGFLWRNGEEQNYEFQMIIVYEN